MRNLALWQPSKYRPSRHGWVASRDPSQVGPGSLLVCQTVARFYRQAIPLHARGRLVDLGCGKVPLFGLYGQYASTATCVDWPNSPHGNRHVDVLCSLSAALPFSDDAFDTILLSDVLEHLPEPALMWREMFRILAQGGKALINVPYFYGIHEAPFDYYRYSRFALERMAKNAGFEIIELEATGGSPEIMTDLASKHLVLVPVVGKIAARWLQKLVWRLVNTRLGRRVSLKSAAYFPLGYQMVVRKPTACRQPAPMAPCRESTSSNGAAGDPNTRKNIQS